MIVRSFNRIPTLCRLVDALLRQSYSNVEIVIVEQSTEMTAADAAALEARARSPRVVLIRRPPLGGAAARNVGVERSKGELLLFIDDDDLPTSDRWIAEHLAALDDPRCLGVSGKHIHSDEPVHRYSPFMAFVTGTLSYDPILKISTTYVQHDRRTIPVHALHGTNASLRRSAWQRFGGWDEDTAIEDEVSFCFRALFNKAPEEYFAYDPRPTIVRNRDVAGGLDKRQMSVSVFFGHYLDYIHRIIGRYFPLRVLTLYPLYLLTCYFMSVGTIWAHSRRYRNLPARLGAAVVLLASMPVLVGASLLRLLLPASETGKVQAARASRLAESPSPVTDDTSSLMSP